MSKKNRKTRALRVEGLENRELMAGDLGIQLVNGTLHISGSNAGDNIRVMQSGNNLSVIRGDAPPLRTFPLAAVSSLNIVANGGNDRVEVKANSKVFDTFFIDLGSGSNELVDVRIGGAQSATIHARASLGTNVYLDGVFSGLASVDYGTDLGGDFFQTQKSRFNRLDLKMGGATISANSHKPQSTAPRSAWETVTTPSIALALMSKGEAGGVLRGMTASKGL